MDISAPSTVAEKSPDRRAGQPIAWCALAGGALVFGTALVLVLCLLPIAAEAFVLKKLWRWFVVPQFGLLPLTLPVALGFSLAARFLLGWCGSIVTSSQNDVPLLLEFAWYSFLRPASFLAVGALIHHFT
jgi:ABC-type sugar transport system permease subunit